MRVFVSNIPEEGIKLNTREPLLIEGVTLAGPVTVSINVQKVGGRVIVNGDFSCSVELQCGYCLELFTDGIESDFYVKCQPVSAVNTEEGEYELCASDLDIAFYEDDEIDLTELVREQVLLGIPMNPVCSLSCKGLCPVCGLNRNKQDCGCSTDTVDSRLKVLMKLKGENNGEPNK